MSVSSALTKSIYSISHEIHFNTKVSLKLQRRRCFTEMCRKVDGSKKDQKDQKGQTKQTGAIVQHPYTASCFDLFICE